MGDGTGIERSSIRSRPGTAGLLILVLLTSGCCAERASRSDEVREADQGCYTERFILPPRPESKQA